MPSGAKPGERRGGRETGAKNKAVQQREDRFAEAQAVAIAALSPEEIDNITPEQVLMLAMRTAVRGGNLILASKVAVDVMPYKVAKKAPRQDEEDEDHRSVTIKGGLPD